MIESKAALGTMKQFKEEYYKQFTSFKQLLENSCGGYIAVTSTLSSSSYHL